MVRKIFFLAATTAVLSANAQKLEIDGHEAVDLGLSVLWATCNVGANSPEKAGDYYAWGEVITKESYTSTNHTARTWMKKLDADHDAATQKWGENWRIPTKTEWEELLNLEWELKGNGYNVKGNENSIFLPFTGNRQYEELKFTDTGYYMSSNYYYNYFSYFFKLDKNSYKISNGSGWVGNPVRPVCEKPDASKLNYVEKENANTVYKTFENGQIVIVKNGVKYNLAGQKL